MEEAGDGTTDQAPIPLCDPGATPYPLWAGLDAPRSSVALTVLAFVSLCVEGSVGAGRWGKEGSWKIGKSTLIYNHFLLC